MATKQAKKAAKKAAQTPKAPGKITKEAPANKLTPLQVDMLGLLHSTGRQHTLEDIKTETGASASVAAMRTSLGKLVELGLAELLENGKYKFAGNRATAMKLAVDNLRVMGAAMGAGELGAMIWADAKTSAKDPKRDTRYFAAASALLSSCFKIGAVYRNVQDGKVVSYGAAA